MRVSVDWSRTGRAVIAFTVAAMFLATTLAPALARGGLDGRPSPAAESDGVPYESVPDLVGMSSDGTRVFFRTRDRLVAADTDARIDIYERSSGTTTLISSGAVNGNGPFDVSFGGASSDGTVVAFVTAERLLTDDTDSQSDVYRWSGGVTTLISAGAVNGNGPFGAWSLGASSDGARVIFGTVERLVAADIDDREDIYQRLGGTTTLISAGAINGNGPFDANFKGASRDRSTVFFATSERLSTNDTDAEWDLYAASGGTTRLVSVGAADNARNREVTFAGSSSDGSKVFFETRERLVATDTDSAIDLYQSSAGSITRVSVGAIRGNGAFRARFAGSSSDGTRVFFWTPERLAATDTEDTDDIYERTGGTTTLITAGGVDRPYTTYLGRVSSDGTRVYFNTLDRLVAGDTDGAFDVYLRSGGTTTLVSKGTVNGNGNAYAWFRGASEDGTRVFFETRESLVAADTDHNADIYERAGGTTRLVSAGAINGNQRRRVTFRGASSDGSRVFFITREALVPADKDDAFDIYERSGGTTKLVSRP